MSLLTYIGIALVISYVISSAAAGMVPRHPWGHIDEYREDKVFGTVLIILMVLFTIGGFIIFWEDIPK